MKLFNELDENFICENCGKNVSKLVYSSRDHCPYCLYSKHVDINPGDRANECKGLLRPVGIEKFKDTFKILYICQKCKEQQDGEKRHSESGMSDRSAGPRNCRFHRSEHYRQRNRER